MEQFTFVKRGYDPEEVDKYITTLEQVIKSYKDKDNAIKNAIISAQRTAEDVVKNAQAEADTYKAQMGEQLVGMRGALDRQRASLQNFQNANTNTIKKCIQELEKFDMNEMFSRIDEMDAAIAALQGLETINKDRLLQSQSRNMDSGGYARDMMPDMDIRGQEPREREQGYPRDTAPMRDAGRDIMRGSAAPYDIMRGHDIERDPRDSHETIRDTGMDMMRVRNTAPASYEAMRDTSRDILGREQYAPHETMRSTSRSTMDRDGMQQPYTQQEYAPPQPYMQQETMRDTGRDYAPEPPREIMRDTRRDTRNDFGRDIRRDYGRDMRSDTGRDVRRDDYTRDNDMGRLDSRREPMRDMGRYYPQDADNYGDQDQNLLPPVASLM